VEQAAAAQVMLAVEIMDTAFMNSISKWKKWDEMLASPWFTVYPDVGNLSAWGNDVTAELKLGIDRIAAIHLKDTQPVTDIARPVPRRAVWRRMRRFCHV
jgi:hexulose-6-phosphate isomerase